MGRFGLRALLVALGIGTMWLEPAAAEEPDVDVNAVRGRTVSEAACLDRAHGRFERTLRLFEESRVQLRARGVSAEVREDAARALEALEGRLRSAIEEMAACVPLVEPRARVNVVPPPDDPVADRVAQVNPATERVDGERRLAQGVHVVVGERVDGHGRADTAAVQNAVSRIGRRLGACYEHMARRRGPEKGTGILVFTVESAGNVRGIGVEQLEVGASGFARCLELAASHLRVPGGSQGGDATYSYTLRFGR